MFHKILIQLIVDKSFKMSYDTRENRNNCSIIIWTTTVNRLKNWDYFGHFSVTWKWFCLKRIIEQINYRLKYIRCRCFDNSVRNSVKTSIALAVFILCKSFRTLAGLAIVQLNLALILTKKSLVHDVLDMAVATDASLPSISVKNVFGEFAMVS